MALTLSLVVHSELSLSFLILHFLAGLYLIALALVFYSCRASCGQQWQGDGGEKRAGPRKRACRAAAVTGRRDPGTCSWRWRLLQRAQGRCCGFHEEHERRQLESHGNCLGVRLLFC